MGDDDDDGPPIDAPAQTHDGGTRPDAPDAAWNYESLITSTWSMPLGSYGNFCASMPITNDVWVDAFELAQGTSNYNEHSIVYLTKEQPPESCPAHLDATAQVLYIAGNVDGAVDDGTATGTYTQQRTLFPAGYGVHLQPTSLTGYYLAINSHIYNDPATSTAKISGTTEIDFHAATGTSLTSVDMALLGQYSIDVTAGNGSASGECNPVQSAGEQWNLVMIAPHMHDSGSESMLQIVHQSAERTLYDEPYSAKQEGARAIANYPVLVDTGDTLITQCAYNTKTPPYTGKALDQDGESVPEDFGSMSTPGGEICWAGVYKYPTGNTKETQAATTPPYACVVSHP